MADQPASGGDKKPSPYLVAVSDETRDAGKHFAPAAARNIAPIIEVLRDIAPQNGRALEIASGTGQHAIAFAGAFPGMEWQPSDPESSARASIAAWISAEAPANVVDPLTLDTTAAGWETALTPGWDLVVCINMIHIAPWAACTGLMRGAGLLLAPRGVLYLYGPYQRDGGHTAPSNADFDASLRARNPAWGVRALEDVVALAVRHGLVHDSIVDMPANNLSLIFRRGG